MPRARLELTQKVRDRGMEGLIDLDLDVGGDRVFVCARRPAAIYPVKELYDSRKLN